MKLDYISGCLMKASFNTEADALLEPNKRVYFCLFCGKWHRATPENQKGFQHSIKSYEKRLQNKIK